MNEYSKKQSINQILFKIKLLDFNIFNPINYKTKQNKTKQNKTKRKQK